MLIYRIFIAFIVVAWCAVPAFSQEKIFYQDSEEIVKALSESKPRTRGLTRSFVPSSAGKTRTIVVLAREDDQDVSTSVTVREGDDISRVNLKVEFDRNSSGIRPGAYGLLKELGKALTDSSLQNKRISILGHTDSDGSDRYNLELSLKRAESVKSYLVGNFGISPRKIRIFGYGEKLPLVDNDTSSNKQTNRRVEIRAE